MGPTEADCPNLVPAIRRHETVQAIVDQAVNAVSALLETIILHKGEKIEIAGSGQRDAVLLDIGGILGGIELDVLRFLYIRHGSPPQRICTYDCGFAP